MSPKVPSLCLLLKLPDGYSTAYSLSYCIALPPILLFMAGRHGRVMQQTRFVCACDSRAEVNNRIG